MINDLTYGEFFAGCGGASLGLSRAGFKGAYAIDWNKGALDILKANHPDIQEVIHADVNAIGYSRLPEVDLLWASPVCCNYSKANSKRQEADADFQSVGAIASAAQKSQTVVIENVANYYKSLAFKNLSSLLFQQGFKFHKIFSANAKFYGNPASRDRTYAVFAKHSFEFKLPCMTSVRWDEVLLEHQDLWEPSKPTTRQWSVWYDYQKLYGVFGQIVAIDRCGYRSPLPRLYVPNSSYPCIKSHSHHDGKNPKPGYGKIGSYRSYMDFVYDGQFYSVTPQILGILNGFPKNYDWGCDRAQAAAACGNAVVPRMAEIIGQNVSSIKRASLCTL